MWTISQVKENGRVAFKLNIGLLLLEPKNPRTTETITHVQ